GCARQAHEVWGLRRQAQEVWGTRRKATVLLPVRKRELAPVRRLKIASQHGKDSSNAFSRKKRDARSCRARMRSGQWRPNHARADLRRTARSTANFRGKTLTGFRPDSTGYIAAVNENGDCDHGRYAAHAGADNRQIAGGGQRIDCRRDGHCQWSSSSVVISGSDSESSADQPGRVISNTYRSRAASSVGSTTGREY